MAANPLIGSVRALSFALCLALLPACAHAATSANAIKLARQIVELKGAANLLAPLVKGVIERVKYMNLQTNPSLQKPLNEVAALLTKQYASRVNELYNNLAKLYASKFTEPELKQILAFYKSAAGQKVIKQEPAIFEENLGGLKAWEEKFGEEILDRFRAEMKKRGHPL